MNACKTYGKPMLPVDLTTNLTDLFSRSSELFVSPYVGIINVHLLLHSGEKYPSAHISQDLPA